jgi:hypothetical protein
MEYWSIAFKTITPILQREELEVMDSQKVVTPVKTGVQAIYTSLLKLDSDFRRNDRNEPCGTFSESIREKFLFLWCKNLIVKREA